VAFLLTPQIETIEFDDGDRAYCRTCDNTEPMRAARASMVACRVCGTRQHAGNLIVNGSHRR